MRRRARTDANHAEIREALRACGWTVIDTSRAGSGFPDLVAAKAGRIELIEVKDGSKPPSAQKATTDECRVFSQLAKAGVQVRTITAVEQVAAL
jgi:Holliday junction resolvase